MSYGASGVGLDVDDGGVDADQVENCQANRRSASYYDDDDGAAADAAALVDADAKLDQKQHGDYDGDVAAVARKWVEELDVAISIPRNFVGRGVGLASTAAEAVSGQASLMGGDDVDASQEEAAAVAIDIGDDGLHDGVVRDAASGIDYDASGGVVFVGVAGAGFGADNGSVPADRHQMGSRQQQFG